MTLLKIIFFILISISTTQIQLVAQTKNQLTAKKELAKLIIDKFLTDSIDQEYIYLLRENFSIIDSIEDINSKRKTKIKLVDKFVLGEDTYFFQPILMKGNLATVFWGNSWRSLSGLGFHEIITEYKCQKKKEKWKCQARKFTISQS